MTDRNQIFEPGPSTDELFRDLGASGFRLSEIVRVFGTSRSKLYTFLKANPVARAQYKAAFHSYRGPGGRRAALRVGMSEEQTDALIVAGVLYLGQRGDEQSARCLRRLARRLVATGAPDLASLIHG